MSQRIKILIAFFLIYFVWGSTFFGVSIALKSFPPFLLCALRFLIGGMSLVAYSSLRKEKLPIKNDIIHFSMWGIVIFGGGVIAVVWAQQFLPSSLASIIITTPFLFVVLDKPQWNTNFKNGWILSGIVLGLAGVIVMLSQKSTSENGTISKAELFAMFVMIVGSFLWVIGSLQLRKKQSHISVYVKTAIHLIAAGLFALAVSFFLGEFNIIQLQSVKTEAVFSLLYLSIMSTTITFLAFIWLLKNKSSSVVSTYSYVNPLVAVLIGVLIGGETINKIQILAMFVILLGVLFINIPNYKLNVLNK